MSGVLSQSRYQAIRVLGSGSFGEIRVARDITLGREVAIKMLHPQFVGNEQVVQRFLHEAETLARIEHPHIVPIHDSGRLDDGRPYFAMRLVEGDDLEQRVTDLHERFHRSPGATRFETDEFLSLLLAFRQAAEAIGYAHQKGVVHRDVKPSNILIGRDGEALVIDWGTAKWLDKRNQQALDLAATMVAGMARRETVDRPLDTMQGMILGTPAFMSPEQAVGDIERVNQQSDIYSLGATLYFLVTGRPPHKGELVNEVIGRAQLGNVTRPQSLIAAVPDRLARICERSLEAKPADRYQSVAEMVADLQKYFDERASKVCTADIPVAAAGTARRSVFWPTACVLLMMGSLIAGGAAGIYHFREQTLAQEEIDDLQYRLDVIDRTSPDATGGEPSTGPATDEATQARIATLQEDLRQANNNLRDASSQRAAAEQDVARLEGELQQLRTKLSEIENSGTPEQRELQGYLDRIDELQAQLAAANTELGQIDTDYVAAVDRIEDLEGQLGEANHDLATAESQVTRLNSELRQARDALANSNNNGGSVELVSSYTAMELREVLRAAGYRVQTIDNNREVRIEVDGRQYFLYPFDDGDLMLTYIHHGGNWTTEDVNRWNAGERLSRAYLNDASTSRLESDLRSDAGLTHQLVIDYVELFDSTALKFRDFMDNTLSDSREESGNRRRTLGSFFDDNPPPAPGLND